MKEIDKILPPFNKGAYEVACLLDEEGILPRECFVDEQGRIKRLPKEVRTLFVTTVRRSSGIEKGIPPYDELIEATMGSRNEIPFRLNVSPKRLQDIRYLMNDQDFNWQEAWAHTDLIYYDDK